MQRSYQKCVQALAFIVSAFALAGGASAQVVLTSPAAPVLVGANISMGGTGYPTGTINAASTNIVVTPAPGSGSPVSFAPTTVSGSGGSRTLIFKLPASLTANLPYNATVCASGQTTAAVAFTTATCANITINPAGSLANVSPGAGQVGTAVNVTITGLFTHFAQATSVVSVGGSGVTPSNMAVTPGSSTQLTATFTIASNATPGVRSVTVTSGSEVATLAVGFVVTTSPGLSFSIINPGSAAQGSTLNVDVQGINTHFVQGTTTANFGNGITVNSIVVNSQTDMTVNISIGAIAPAGGRPVTVVTGGEFATAPNGFTVTSSGASITSVTPSTPVPQGGNATLALVGLGTHWVTSGTNVSFGGGINAGAVTVTDNTHLTVNLSVGPGVPAGVYGVTTTTAGEVAMYSSAVTVTASTPFISNVAPTSGVQGANNLDVIVTGTYTSFTTGAIFANFGPLITVNSVTPNTPTSVDINISISNVASTGGRAVTLTSNGTLFTFNFAVTADGATVTSVSPGSGLQQSSYALTVTGANTHWVQGTTVASLGDGNITINRVIINSPTSALVNITLGAQAALGLHGFSMTTGGEVATLANAFNVLPFTPSLSMSPSTGKVGTTVNVNFNGNFTHFSNQTEANIDGEGVQIQNFAVVGGSPTQATAQFVIASTAPATPAYLCVPGGGAWHNITLTTGGEIVTTSFCVTSTPAVLTNITPNNSPQNNALNVTITGQYTNFQNSTLTTPGSLGTAPTTVGFGPDITTSNLTINSATSLTVHLAIDPVAALGWRLAYVNTGAEQLTIGFLIDSPASATLVSISPNSAQQGQSISGVTITGNLTNFVQGSTVAIVGAGITVSNLQILSSEVATATISVSPTTTLGGRTVEMITGSEDVTGPLFTVNPGIAAISFTPSCTSANVAGFQSCTPTLATVYQGAIVPFNVTGTGTNFLQGETTMYFDGSDIAVTQLTVNSPTSITGQAAVSYTATPGFRNATATTGGQVAPTSSYAIDVIQVTGTSLNLDVNSAPQGTSHLQITLNGQNTNWVNGTTTATFGNNNGLVVNSLTVNSPTVAILDLTVAGTAYTGLYTLTVTTNHGGGNIEQQTLINVFTVTTGAAIITNVAPNGNSTQGSTEGINITGQNTSWINGVTTAYFTTGGCIGVPNPGVNVGAVVVNSTTSATLSISIASNAQTGLQTLCMTTLGELVNYQNSFTINPGTPTLNGVTPVNAEQGTQVTLNIIGQFTHWVQGTTTITFGQGITLTQPLTITSATAATANIAIDPLAYTGARNVVLNTPLGGGGDEIVQGTAFFNVTPGPAILSTISPTTGNQGTHILMQLNGENTHWAQGLSQVTINGAGYDITVNGVQVQSPTTLVMDMNISPTANLGLRTVYVSTGGENVILQNGFLVTGGIPSISSISPSSAQQGSNNVNVMITGIFTTWTQGTTNVSFGPNINLTNYVVGDNTHLTAVINVPNGAPLGLQTVTVQTGGQILTTQFNILSNAPPTPYISYEYPSVALVGQTLDVNLAGAYTNWVSGNAQITFGTGIVVNTFQVTGETTAIANITIVPSATLGTRTVTLTTGLETETTSFTVTVGTPAITMISPSSIIQGQTLDVDIIGQYTTFNASTIFAFSNSHITLNTVTLFGPTAARVNISADIDAPLGGMSISATTGSQVAYNQVGFSVTPSQATIISVSPNTAPQGAAPVVQVTGFETNWVNNVTVFNLGGIGITNAVVNGPTSATLTLSIPELAYVGEYSISATTVGEYAYLNNAFVVTPGTPILLSATNNTAQQGTEISVGILGQLTNFVQGVTTVSLGNGVNVTGVTVTEPTSLTVTGSVDPLAYTGSRNIIVTTGAQQLVLFGDFYVSPGTAQVSQLTPASAGQGQTLNVAITGTNTHFTANQTIANFGQGISVNTLQITDATDAVANITIAANANVTLNTVTMTTLGESASGGPFKIISTTPIIDFINPTFLSQGQSGTISLTGSFTNWVNGNSVASFGPGVQVTGTNVTGSGAATANVTVLPTATVGTYTAQMSTNLAGGGQEVATKANAFTINAGSAAITSATPTTPATIHQGDTDDTIVITGSATHFSASSLVAFCNGITPVQINFNTTTQLTVIVNVASTTAVGACGATVTTGGEIATGASLFNVLAGIPIVTNVNANSAAQNAQNLNVNVTAQFTHFVQGTTTASFGAGITVNGIVTVTSPTTATVNITVLSTATVGFRTVVMTTNLEVANGTNQFSVTAGQPQLLNINPNTGAQNSTQTVTINGLFTNFIQGTSVVTFSGGNVTAGVAQVNGPAQLQVSVTVAPGASATARTVTVTTGAEVDSLVGAFTVLPGAPTILTISPNVGVPNTNNLQVTITGLFTSFTATGNPNPTQASFGPFISVGGAAEGAYGPINVTSATTAVATINIDPAATPVPSAWPVNLTNIDNPSAVGINISVPNGFTIQSITPTAPSVLSVSPQNGAGGVPLNTSYTVVFSSPINGATVAANNAYLVSTAYGCNFAYAIASTWKVDASGRILTLTPTSVLAVGQGYYFCLNQGGTPYIKDPANNTIGGSDWSFTTGFAVSNTGPTLQASNIATVSPVSGAVVAGDTGIGTNVTPILGFSTPLDPATQLAGITVLAGATPVPGTWSYNNSYTQITFTPAGGFTAGTSYSMNITAALTDTVGNPVVNPQTINFSTGAGAITTGATLLSYTPISNSTTGENPTIRMVWSQPMNPLSFTQGQCYLYQNDVGFYVSGTSMSVSADRKTYTMNLPGPLSPSTYYYWQCGPVYDQEQHYSGYPNVYFYTGTTVDSTAPVVTLVSPPNGQTGVPVNAPVYVLLSKQIDPTTVTNNAITLSPAVAGTVSLPTGSTTMTFTPAANLATSQTYTINVSGFSDLDGNALTPFSSTFTTSASATPDTTNGTVSMLPSSGTTNVPTNTQVIFNFSKTFDPTTVNTYGGGNIRLYDNTAGTYVNGVITMNGALNSVTFTPVVLLEPSHQYCGYGAYPFTNYIRDLAGNTFGWVYSQCFTTATGTDTTPPQVISVMPTSGATGIGPNNPVTVTFSKPMNPNTLSSQNVAMYVGTALYSTNFNRSFDSTSLTFNLGNLSYNTTYTVVITPNVTDLAGNNLAAQYVSTFTIMPQPTTTVPNVTAVHPSSGATGVPTNASITWFISEPLNTATVPGAIQVSQNGVLINGTVTYGSNNQVVVFTPTGGFTAGSYVTAFFTSAATDNSGNPLTSYQSSFSIVPNLTTTPATVVAFTPSEYSNTNTSNTVIEMEFSKPLNTATVTAGSFFVTEYDSTPVTGNFTFLNNNTVIRFTPTAPLPGGPYYRVHYENTITDSTGLAIAGAADNTWYFYTNGSASVNSTTPSVTSIAPTNGAPNIGTNSTIRVQFNEPIDPFTIYSPSLSLSSGGSQIPYNASFDGSGTILTIVPQAALPASSTIIVGFTSGITDYAGNAMAAFNPVFFTGATPDFTRPVVVSANFTNGQSNVPVTSVFTMTYSKPIDTRTEVLNSNVYLYDNVLGQYVASNMTFSTDGTQVTLQPVSNLPVNHNFYIYIDSVQDLDGNQMNNAFNWSFTTALVGPSGGPVVTFTLPPTGFQVPTNFKPVVQFDRPVDFTSLGGITLQQGGNPVPFTISGSGGNTIVNLAPTALLAANSSFTFTIAGVKDTAGNTMAGSSVSNFTTGASVDLVPPVVTNYEPENGVTTGTNPVIRLTYNEPINPILSNGVVYLQNQVTDVSMPGVTISTSADLKTQTLSYPTALSPNTSYCWRTYNVYDLAGNYTTPNGECFTTSSGAVNSAPTVTSVTPPNGQTGVPINALIQVLLSAPIDPTTVNINSMTLTPAAPAGSSVSLASSGQTMTLTLGGTLAASTTYQLNVGGFKDVNGNTVTAFTSSFTTSTFNVTSGGTISLTSPAPGSVGVATTASITVTLSEPVDPNSVAGNLIFLLRPNNNGNEQLPGTTVIGNGGSTLTFTPTSPMPPSTVMSLYVGYPCCGANYLYDLAGNTLSYIYNATFTTASTPDTTPPSVLSITPAAGTTNVGPNAVVTLIFTKALNSGTVNNHSFTLYNGFTNLNANVGISSDNRTVTLTTTLPYSSTITAAVATTVQDIDGNSLASPYSSTFNTQTQPLTASPTVTMMRPSNGSSGVPVNQPITLYFSAPMNAGTVPGALFVSQNGVLVTGSVSVAPDGRSALWTGPGFLNSAYIQIFFSGAQDTSGNYVNYYSASFSTVANLTSTPATVVSYTPSNQSSNAPTNTVIEMQFSKPLNTSTVTNNSFYVLETDDLPKISGAFTFLNNNTTIRFTPSAPLSTVGGPYYRVHYENSITDSGGLPIAGSADNTWYFYLNSGSNAPNNTTPTLTSVAPTNGATAVGDNATIRFSFNELMDTNTINTQTVSLMNGGTPIPYFMSFSGSSYTTVTLTPYAPLPVNSTLTLTLTGGINGISDTSANVFAGSTITFQTGAGADFSAPYVVYSTINNNTPAVPVNSTFTLVFSKPLDANTVANVCGYFYLYDNNTGCVASTVTLSPDGLTVSFVPAVNMTPSISYALYARGATDLNGNAQTGYSVGFNTASGTATTPPTVVYSSPANTASGVPLNALIEAEFSEAVSGTTLTNVTLTQGGNPVPSTVSLQWGDSTVRLTPSSLLLPNTTYTATLTGVQDVAGNTMVGTYTFSFTTGTNVDLNSTPNVVSINASGLPLTYNVNVNNVPDNPTITIVLDTPIEPASLNNGSLLLYNYPSQNTTYPLNVALSADQMTITVTLAPGTLTSGLEYQFRVNWNARYYDWAGNTGTSYLYYFTTQ